MNKFPVSLANTVFVNKINKKTNKVTIVNGFFSLLEKYDGYKIVEKPKQAKTDQIASFEPLFNDKYGLKQIITSPKTRNSDRLYIYSLVTEKGEK